MDIPTFLNIEWVDEDKMLTSKAQMYHDTLNNVLRNGLSGNGWTLPTVTMAQLTQIVGFTGASALPRGTIWYVSDHTPPCLVTLMDNGSNVSTLYQIDVSPYP